MVNNLHAKGMTGLNTVFIIAGILFFASGTAYFGWSQYRDYEEDQEKQAAIEAYKQTIKDRNSELARKLIEVKRQEIISWQQLVKERPDDAEVGETAKEETKKIEQKIAELEKKLVETKR